MPSAHVRDTTRYDIHVNRGSVAGVGYRLLRSGLASQGIPLINPM